MDFANLTPCLAIPFFLQMPKGPLVDVMAVRITYDLQPDGTAVPCMEQPGPVLADQWHGGPNVSSLRQESDLVHGKPRCDLVVAARAHAPGDRPLASWKASVRLLSPEGTPLAGRTLRVLGPRSLRREGSTWRLEDPGTAREVPLRHESAFGGWLRLMASDPAHLALPPERLLEGVDVRSLHEAFGATGEDALVAQAWWPPNTVGAGYAPAWWLDFAHPESLPAPSLERPEHPFTLEHFHAASQGRAQEGDPALQALGLGPLRKDSPTRLPLAGTYDEAWQREVAPAYPLDFDFLYWNAAAPDLRTDHLTGDEVLEAVNLLPEGSPFTRKDALGDNVLRVQLPGRPFGGRLVSGGRTWRHEPALDTVFLDLEDPDHPRLSLVARAFLHLPEGVQSYELRLAKGTHDAWPRGAA